MKKITPARFKPLKLQSEKLPPRIALGLFLAAACLAGISTAKDYGLSWDELGIYAYAEQALAAYAHLPRPWEYADWASELRLQLYGPAHFMLATLLSRLVIFLDQSWTYYEAHHLAYFLTFLLGIPAFYFLCARWMSEWAALGATLLFATQPLIWGNAFINPKDLPFMTFFIMSIALGVAMLDDAATLPRWKTVAAGIMLGVTISTRAIGPLAGGLVILYGLWKQPRKTLRVAPLYLMSAAASAYLTWPYLWAAPVSRFWESLSAMSKYPMRAKSLFAGNLYPSEQIPLAYFPTLSALQLTEPLLFLAVIGIAVAFRDFFKGGNKEPLLFFAACFLAPFLAVSLRGSTLYDNARQLMFLLFPFFILAGIGLDALLKRVKMPLLQGALIIAALLPGVYACLHLHPYEYAYYNQLIGGVSGAFRKFDLDYSGTSFKEAIKYINANSEPNAQTVVLVGPRHIARVYIRKSLKDNLLGEVDELNPNGAGYYYVLFLTRGNADVNVCEDGESVYAVERDGGTLAYVKKVYSTEPCWR